MSNLDNVTVDLEPDLLSKPGGVVTVDLLHLFCRLLFELLFCLSCCCSMQMYVQLICFLLSILSYAFDCHLHLFCSHLNFVYCLLHILALLICFSTCSQLVQLTTHFLVQESEMFSVSRFLFVVGFRCRFIFHFSSLTCACMCVARSHPYFSSSIFFFIHILLHSYFASSLFFFIHSHSYINVAFV